MTCWRNGIAWRKRTKKELLHRKRKLSWLALVSYWPKPEPLPSNRISKGVHQFTEAGRRFFLNPFLLDIIHRPEFEGNLRIFPELELSVTETSGTKKLKLNGRTEYTIGFGKGKDNLSKWIPREVHLVAVEAKTRIGISDLLQCIDEAVQIERARGMLSHFVFFAYKVDPRPFSTVENMVHTKSPALYLPFPSSLVWRN